MPLSSVTYTGVNGQQAYGISFSFLQQDHVELYVNGILKTITTHYTINTAGTILTIISPTIVGGEVIAIVRNTPADEDDLLVTFTEGAGLTASSLNKSQLQLLYIEQENRDDITEALAADSAMPTVTGANEDNFAVVDGGAWAVFTPAQSRTAIGLSHASLLTIGSTATGDLVQYAAANALPAADGSRVRTPTAMFYFTAVADINNDTSGTWYQNGGANILAMSNPGDGAGYGEISDESASITSDFGNNAIILTAGRYEVEVNAHVINGSAVSAISVAVAVTDDVSSGSTVVYGRLPVTSIGASNDHALRLFCSFTLSGTKSIKTRIAQTDAGAVTIPLRGDSWIKVKRVGA
jgi:hypothetical protein